MCQLSKHVEKKSGNYVDLDQTVYQIEYVERMADSSFHRMRKQINATLWVSLNESVLLSWILLWSPHVVALRIILRLGRGAKEEDAFFLGKSFSEKVWAPKARCFLRTGEPKLVDAPIMEVLRQTPRRDERKRPMNCFRWEDCALTKKKWTLCWGKHPQCDSKLCVDMPSPAKQRSPKLGPRDLMERAGSPPLSYERTRNVVKMGWQQRYERLLKLFFASSEKRLHDFAVHVPSSKTNIILDDEFSRPKKGLIERKSQPWLTFRELRNPLGVLHGRSCSLGAPFMYILKDRTLQAESTKAYAWYRFHFGQSKQAGDFDMLWEELQGQNDIY